MYPLDRGIPLLGIFDLVVVEGLVEGVQFLILSNEEIAEDDLLLKHAGNIVNF